MKIRPCSAACLLCLWVPTAFGANFAIEAWRRWSPREEIAPVFSIEPAEGRAGGLVLKLAALRSSDFGAWRSTAQDVKAGKVYRFVAWYRTAQIADPRRSVIARLQWLEANGQPLNVTVRPPEYPLDVARDGEWAKMEYITRAPEGAAALDVQLSLAFASGGSVWWDDVSLVAVDDAPGRNVRVMTIGHRPKRPTSPAVNLDAFAKLARASAHEKPDIVCLPEGISLVSTGRSYVEVSEPVPGPTTEALGVLARELGAYVVAGIYERVAPAVYNTAVLIDRRGQLVGSYRKTHLPREEWEAGIAPGDGYPVFQTDFGRIGLMICWDLQFPEPWRALGLQGAEIAFVPAWGGSEVLLQARAIENHMFVVSSGYDIKSGIIAPDGKVVCEASADTPVVVATIDLDQKIYQPWIGDMSTRTWKERRGHLPPVNGSGRDE